MVKSLTRRTGLLVAATAVSLAGFAHAQNVPATEAESTVGRVESKDGTMIAYERIGAGPTLILVSGALSDRTGGARMARIFAPHFSVITYDRRGRGESSDTPPYQVEREVEDMDALIREFGDRAFVFGTSSGAVLALEAAARLGPKVTKAVLFEPPFIVDESRDPVPGGFAKQTADLVAAGRRGDAVEYFMTVAVGVPAEQIAPMKESPMWPQLERLAHTLAYDGELLGDTLAGRPLPADRWKDATNPILVLDGGKSDAWLHNAARGLAETLPNASHQTLPGLDHSATFMAPQAFLPVLTEYFLEVEP